MFSTWSPPWVVHRESVCVACWGTASVYCIWKCLTSWISVSCMLGHCICVLHLKVSRILNLCVLRHCICVLHLEVSCIVNLCVLHVGALHLCTASGSVLHLESLCVACWGTASVYCIWKCLASWISVSFMLGHCICVLHLGVSGICVCWGTASVYCICKCVASWIMGVMFVSRCVLFICPPPMNQKKIFPSSHDSRKIFLELWGGGIWKQQQRKMAKEKGMGWLRLGGSLKL